jgi:hypothetical protein
MSNTANIGRGDTFSITFDWNPVGGPSTLIGATVSSSFLDKCGTLWDFDVVVAEDGLSFTVSYPYDTSEWAIGVGKWDIKFVFGSTTHSEMLRIDVAETVTK